jgi:cytochrome P450
VLFVSRHPELFISSRGITGPGLRNPEQFGADAGAQPGGVSFITMDPPHHVKLRRLVNKRLHAARGQCYGADDPPDRHDDP